MGSVSLRKEARFPTVLSSDVAHSALSGAMGYRLRFSVLVGKISVLAPYVSRGVSAGSPNSPNKGITHPTLVRSKQASREVGRNIFLRYVPVRQSLYAPYGTLTARMVFYVSLLAVLEVAPRGLSEVSGSGKAWARQNGSRRDRPAAQASL